MAIVVTLALKIAALVRLRTLRPGPRAFKVPLTLTVGARNIPVGLSGPRPACLSRARWRWSLAGDVPSLTTLAILGSCALLFIGMAVAVGRHGPRSATPFDFLPAAELSLGHIDARPGNVLVPVRNPHLLAHVAGALQSSRDRDVVVMTVRAARRRRE